jgi:hypothetical protein
MRNNWKLMRTVIQIKVFSGAYSDFIFAGCFVYANESHPANKQRTEIIL